VSKRSHLLPVFIYLTGLGSLLLSDVLVTKFLSAESIATWAEIRSLIGIASILCLVGLDQVLIRSPESSGRIMKILALQIPSLAMVVAALTHVLGIGSHWISVAALCAASAASLALFQFYRTHNKRSASQLAQQGWKFLVFVVICCAIYKNQEIELTSIVASTVLIAVIASSVPLLFFRFPKRKAEDTKALYGIGIRYLTTSLLLALAVYAEQLVVGSLGRVDEAAHYFTHSTYFLFPISIVNGYLAFNIGPWVRSNRDLFINTLRTKWSILLSVVALYSVVIHLLGWGAWIGLDPNNKSPILGLQMLLLFSCVMRTLYILPAGYFGVFGTSQQHDALIRLQMVSLVAASLVFIALFYFFNLNIIYSTAMASSTNWLARTSVGFLIMRKIEIAKKESMQS
jgi:hypothetical protein